MTTPTRPTSPSFEEWEEQVCRTFVPLQVRLAGEGAAGFRGAVTSAPLGTVTLADVRTSRSTVERTPRLIRSSDPELVKLGWQRSGTSVVEQDSRQALLRPGDLAIYDTSRPYRIVSSDDCAVTVAMFPRQAMRLPQAGMGRVTAVRLAGDQGLAALLTPLIAALGGTGPASGAVATHLGDAVVDLTAAALAQQLALGAAGLPPSTHHVLVSQVRRFVEDHLSDPDLSPASVAAAHFVSLRHLQQVFEAEGESVSALIRARRLERCRRDLLDPRLGSSTIGGIAARWGFGDPAHFSRLFRRTYGASPRELRTSASSPEPVMRGRGR